MDLKALLTRLLELEAADSGIPEAEFKLGYLLSFVSSESCQTAEAMRTEALARIRLLTGQKHGTTHMTQQSAKAEAQELVTQETTANNSQPPPTTANAAPQHGGPRQPGPGKKLGRPSKKPKEKAVCTTITLNSPKTLKTLQSRAKRAKLKPGAYIERELGL